MQTVLIVDDEPDVRFSLESILEQHGLASVVAENGKDGLSVFNENRPDMVITDLVMPVMSGIDLIYAIRQSDTAMGVKTPIIAISGGGGGAAAGDILREAEHAGADVALTKPFTMEELKSAMDSVSAEWLAK